MTDQYLDRPIVTLKLATSLDGRIATVIGQSKWITGPEARAVVHHMRASHDCVLTGIGTVLADDPELTARCDPPAARQPVRAVLDSNARTPAASKLLATHDSGPVCLFHAVGVAVAQDNAVRLHVDSNPEGEGLDLQAVLKMLQNRFQVTSVMVEAGAQLAGAFLQAKLVDKLVWFRAPIIIGGDGLSVFSALGIDELSDALAFENVDIVSVGMDRMETYHSRIVKLEK